MHFAVTVAANHVDQQLGFHAWDLSFASGIDLHYCEDVRVVAAFVPVDDEHTLLYLRFYQKLLTTPILGKWVAQLSMPFNVRIAHQDRRVVVTQQPKPSALQSGEKLIQGDYPIIQYRRRRHELLQQTGAID